MSADQILKLLDGLKTKDGTMTKSAKVLLADVEKTINGSIHPSDKIKEDRKTLIEKIKKNHYDDFNSPYATPLLILADHLKKCELDELVTNVYEGKYDA